MSWKRATFQTYHILVTIIYIFSIVLMSNWMPVNGTFLGNKVVWTIYSWYTYTSLPFLAGCRWKTFVHNFYVQFYVFTRDSCTRNTFLGQRVTAVVGSSGWSRWALTLSHLWVMEGNGISLSLSSCTRLPRKSTARYLTLWSASFVSWAIHCSREFCSLSVPDIHSLEQATYTAYSSSIGRVRK